MPKTYLLADHSLVAQAFAMRRRVGEPEPIQDGPIIPNGSIYGSVLRDPTTGMFHMWYLGGEGYKEYYATSADGIEWDYPNLDILPADEHNCRNAFMTRGSVDSNGFPLVGGNGPEGFSVLDAEQQDHPAARARFTALYLANLREGLSGLCVAYSDDGIHWTADENNPVIHSWMDTSHSLVWDPDARRYSVYGRPPVRVSVVVEANRYVTHMESEDLIHWSPATTVLNTDDADADPWNEIDEGELTGSNEPSIRGKNRQVYGMSVFKQAGLFIGMARILDVPSGAGWIEFVHSHDGVEWYREPLREPFIAPRPGSWENPMLLTTATSPPVTVGNDLWIYHNGQNKGHHKKNKKGKRGIGCRNIKKDRWVGYHSSEKDAELLTHPIPAPSGVSLNASTLADGWIAVEVIDAWGNILEGCALEEATRITGDSLAHVVRWGANMHVPATSDTIRLRIRSRNASLWAFEVT